MAVNFIAGPFKLFTAVPGSAAPTAYTGANLTSPWALLANNSQDDAGVVITQSHTYNDQLTQNELLPQEAFRSRIDLTVSCTVKHLDADVLATVAGAPKTSVSAPFTGHSVKLSGPNDPHLVTKLSLVVAGAKAVGSAKHAIAYFPRVYVASNLELNLMLADGAGVPFTFKALKHDTIDPAFYIQS